MSSPTSALRERESELGALRGGLERACAGAGTLLLVEGPAGVGKTELVREARAASERARVTPLEARRRARFPTPRSRPRPGCCSWTSSTSS